MKSKVTAMKLNHTVVPAHDKFAAAEFLASLLGTEVENKTLGSPPGRFAVVRIGDTGLHFDSVDYFEPHHYAFLVNEEEFETIHCRLWAAGIKYSADPFHERVGEFNTIAGGRGLYFRDSNGHNYELLTRS